MQSEPECGQITSTPRCLLEFGAVHIWWVLGMGRPCSSWNLIARGSEVRVAIYCFQSLSWEGMNPTIRTTGWG